MDRPTILRDLAAEALSPGARDVGLRELDDIIKPISGQANLLNGWRTATLAILFIFGLTLATIKIFDPSKAGAAFDWWPVASAAALMLTVNVIWYGYQYWFQDRWPPGLNGSPSTERLHAFLVDYRAEKTRAYKTEFEAVDAKIFANRFAPLLLSDDQGDRLLVQRPTFGTYRAPLVSNAEPARASVNAVDKGIVAQEPIVASAPADLPAEQAPLETELVPELLLEEHSWQWLIELTDEEFQSGLERFLKPIPSHQTNHYRIALVTGRRHLQNNHGYGVLGVSATQLDPATACKLAEVGFGAAGLDSQEQAVQPYVADFIGLGFGLQTLDQSLTEQHFHGNSPAIGASANGRFKCISSANLGNAMHPEET